MNNPLYRVFVTRFVISFIAACTAAAFADAQSTSAITAEEATKRVGEACTVEFIVKSTSHNTKEGTIYLCSELNHTWANNLSIVLSKADGNRFSRVVGKEGFEQFYVGKQVRVTGKVEKLKSGVGIRVSSPSNLVVTNAKPERDPNELPQHPESVPDDFDRNPPSYLWLYFLGFGLVVGVVWFVLWNRRKKKREAGEEE